MLKLRPLRPDDEPAFRAGHAAMAADDGFPFGLGYLPDMSFDGYIKQLDDHRAGINLPDGFVPSTFVVADVAGEVVGRTSIRHRLTERLLHFGGHIGYGV